MSNATSISNILKNNRWSLDEKIILLREKIRKFFLGSKEDSGFFVKLIVYTLLICIGFVYLYPILYMFITSMMPLEDLLDTSVRWIPSTFYVDNYIEAWKVMRYSKAILDSFYMAGVPTICQVVVCSLVGYGFARYNFRGKRLFMALMIFTFIIPPQIIMMPTYVLYNDLGILGSMKAFVLPAILGQGFKSAIFILIYYRFFSQIPQALFEAAEIDGAGHLGSYFKIAIPAAIPAIIIVAIFSFVWYWNETYLVRLYLIGKEGIGAQTSLTTVLLELRRFEHNYNALYPVTQNVPNRINEAKKMAGTVLSILPLLIMYFLLQKQFVESVDRTGITGE